MLFTPHRPHYNPIQTDPLSVLLLGVVVLWYVLLYHILYKMYRVQNNVWGFIKNKTVE